MKQTIFWNGLKNIQKECYLQPIYDVNKNKINVAEALIRVRDFDGSFYDTELLIADVEDKDCSSSIDLWMLEEVCKNMRRLEAAGIERVNVNLSPKSYMDESLETEIRRIMKQYDVQTKQIWFELTELTDVKDKDVLKHLIEKLNKKGFCFALDDFGKGQSNLIRLFDYNFQSIKFDKELVWKGKWTESNSIHVDKEKSENFRMYPDGGTGNWKQTEDGRYWYERADGTYPQNAWEELSGRWYFFDESGHMKTGWIDWEGRSYYCTESGEMLKDAETPDGQRVGPDGAKIEKNAVTGVKEEDPDEAMRKEWAQLQGDETEDEDE